MIAFHSVCRDVAEREVRSVTVPTAQRLPPGEYAFVEWYCAPRPTGTFHETEAG
jgi:hypothetical protein